MSANRDRARPPRAPGGSSRRVSRRFDEAEAPLPQVRAVRRARPERGGPPSLDEVNPVPARRCAGTTPTERDARRAQVPGGGRRARAAQGRPGRRRLLARRRARAARERGGRRRRRRARASRRRWRRRRPLRRAGLSAAKRQPLAEVNRAFNKAVRARRDASAAPDAAAAQFRPRSTRTTAQGGQDDVDFGAPRREPRPPPPELARAERRRARGRRATRPPTRARARRRASSRTRCSTAPSRSRHALGDGPRDPGALDRARQAPGGAAAAAAAARAEAERTRRAARGRGDERRRRRRLGARGRHRGVARAVRAQGVGSW